MAVARVLGTRHALQAVVEVAARRRARVPAALSVVDGLHAASGLLLAGFDRSRRRLGLADASVTSALAGLTAWAWPR